MSKKRVYQVRETQFRSFSLLIIGGCIFLAGCGQMDQSGLEENKAIARKLFEEVINNRNLDAIDEYYAAGYLYHGTEGVEMRGTTEARAFAASILEASNDRQAVVEQQIAEGDLVVTRFTSSGTHTGTFRGKAPTGKTWTIEGIVISRIENGKIAEDWEVIHISGL